MSTLGRLTGLVLTLVAVGANGDDGVRSGEKEATVEPVVEKKLDVPEYSPTQILCVKQRREGSRVKQTKCQTLADWKRDIEFKNMRVSLIRARGKASAWEISP